MQRSVATQKNSKVSVTTEIDAMLTAIIQMGVNHKVRWLTNQTAINHTDGKETCITMNGNDTDITQMVRLVRVIHEIYR